MLKNMFIFLAVVYMVESRLSGFSLVTYEREIGLEVWSVWLMDVIIISDGPITIFLDRNVCSDIVITTSHSVVL